MVIKKKFKLVEDVLEEEFLNEQLQKGYLLDKYNEHEYSFINSDKTGYYMAEFFYKELSTYDIKQYKKRGFDLIVKYKSEVSGFYYFFLSERKIEDDDRSLKDKHSKLLQSKQRVDRFSAVIFLSSFTLFTYLYFKTMNNVYIIVLLLIVLLGAYFGYIYIETIKKLSAYTKIILKKEGVSDGDNEGCSEES